jgi:hypothetical protein
MMRSCARPYCSAAAADSSALRQPGVLVHHAREQSLIERPPVHTDAHRTPVFDGRLDHGAEIIVVLLADIYVAGINAVLGKRPRALGILPQQDVAVVMKVADDGHAHAELIEAVHNLRDGRGRLLGVHRDPHQFGARPRQRHHLIYGAGHIGGVGVGHGLHDNRIIAADFDACHIYRCRYAAGLHCHRSSRGTLILASGSGGHRAGSYKVKL